METDEMELDTIGDRKTALFVIISDTDDTFNFVVSILYTQLFNLLCDKADDEYGGRLPVHVRCLLDEFANIGQIPKFEKLIATIRSREISASIILQSQSQLKAIYKDNADTIVGNCDTTLFLGGKEKTTLKEISEILGKETIDSFNTSETRGRELSHPRTDSSFLTDDMGDTAAGIITLLCEKLPFMAGVGFTPGIAKVLDSKKVSDHHAIIPTMELAKADPDALPESEKNILTLAGARLLFATAEPHIYEAVTAVFSCAGTDFTARGKTVLSDGWKEIERRYRATLKSKPDPEDGENEGVTLPELSEGQSFEKPAAKVTEHIAD